MGIFKSDAQKNREHDARVAQHHVNVGRDPETARHGDETTQVRDEETVTLEQAKEWQAKGWIERMDASKVGRGGIKRGHIVVKFTKKGKRQRFS